MLITIGAMALGLSVWITCWNVGRRREDQELCESGVALGAIAAAVGVLFAYAYVLTQSPVVVESVLAGVGVREIAAVIAGRVANGMIGVAVVAVGIEYWLAAEGRIKHDGLLFEAPLKRLGGEKA